jgi:hypothetical protein
VSSGSHREHPDKRQGGGQPEAERAHEGEAEGRAAEGDGGEQDDDGRGGGEQPSGGSQDGQPSAGERPVHHGVIVAVTRTAPGQPPHHQHGAEDHRQGAADDPEPRVHALRGEDSIGGEDQQSQREDGRRVHGGHRSGHADRLADAPPGSDEVRGRDGLAVAGAHGVQRAESHGQEEGHRDQRGGQRATCGQVGEAAGRFRPSLAWLSGGVGRYPGRPGPAGAERHRGGDHAWGTREELLWVRAEGLAGAYRGDGCPRDRRSLGPLGRDLSPPDPAGERPVAKPQRAGGPALPHVRHLQPERDEATLPRPHLGRRTFHPEGNGTTVHREGESTQRRARLTPRPRRELRGGRFAVRLDPAKFLERGDLGQIHDMQHPDPPW